MGNIWSSVEWQSQSPCFLSFDIFFLSTVFLLFVPLLFFLFYLVEESFLLIFLRLFNLKTLDIVPMQVDYFSVFLSDLACFQLLVGFPPALWATHSSRLNHYDILLLFPSVPYSCRNSYSCWSMSLTHELTC